MTWEASCLYKLIYCKFENLQIRSVLQFTGLAVLIHSCDASTLGASEFALGPKSGT